MATLWAALSALVRCSVLYGAQHSLLVLLEHLHQGLWVEVEAAREVVASWMLSGPVMRMMMRTSRGHPAVKMKGRGRARKRRNRRSRSRRRRGRSRWRWMRRQH
jgi:hypothetical protein